MKTLPEFIKTIGAEAAGKLFCCTTRCAYSWQLMDRYPNRKKASLIVKMTKSHRHGPVTLTGIMGE